MEGANNIPSGILAVFRFKGRVARKAYWQFLPIALLPPVLYASQVDWLEVHPWHGMAKLAVLFVTALPLLLATSRRLNDAGFDGVQAFYPFAPFVILWLGYQVFLWAGLAIGLVGGGLIALLLWFVAALILIPLHLIMLFVTLMTTATVLGQTLVASEPGTNAHGPNLREVL
ncbi:DUF805 domain-containing protein [Pseudosulfitobacter koreensis]|uniref:DUF805 domain-containing protein n=1 Tax=Pseudosulfitobacter koreensis TaxID=2968472 RepID=A0ABT1Z2N5_9RHOB|nr:DUF805 domain-containing protein [Pseudosulfitobacter koreense]